MMLDVRKVIGHQMSENKRFVFVMNRNRDSYQVPLALHEAGLLEEFVTDLYLPKFLLPFVPALLKRRHIDGLPTGKTSSTWRSFLVQAVGVKFGLEMRHILAWSDRLLGLRALKAARRSNANLYYYTSYAPRTGDVLPPHTRLIDFEFHPHAEHTFALLEKDARIYPEVALSFEDEKELAENEHVSDAWRHAESVVCASSMTRRSLEHVGCPAERITVVPYGCQPLGTPPDTRPQGRCQFLFVGQGIQRKGLHHLIRAWKASPPANADLTLVCYHIDPGIKAMLEDSSIVLLGRQEREELDRLYSKADVFVMPSLVEGFGLVYLEALAKGCHVLGTKNTGLPDLPLSEQACTIIEPGDLSALTGALQELALRKAEGKINAEEIYRETGKWQWSDFRREIGAHAAGLVGT